MCQFPRHCEAAGRGNLGWWQEMGVIADGQAVLDCFAALAMTEGAAMAEGEAITGGG